MKIGFIVECGPDGAETRVIPHLARMVSGSIVPEVIPLNDKPILKRDCGKWAKALLGRGCQLVVIVWDLLPNWGEYEGTGCRHDDKETIATSLQHAGLRPSDTRVRLVCIEKMLEAWLLADGRALSDFLSTTAHPVKVPDTKQAESVLDPKSRLKSVFRSSRSRYSSYVDYVHAIEIAKHLPDLNKLRKLASFTRFADYLVSET